MFYFLFLKLIKSLFFNLKLLKVCFLIFIFDSKLFLKKCPLQNLRMKKEFFFFSLRTKNKLLVKFRDQNNILS